MFWVVFEVTVGSSNFLRRFHPKVLTGLSGFNGVSLVGHLASLFFLRVLGKLAQLVWTNGVDCDTCGEELIQNTALLAVLYGGATHTATNPEHRSHFHKSCLARLVADPAE